jgi:hypothetical protein
MCSLNCVAQVAQIDAIHADPESACGSRDVRFKVNTVEDGSLQIPEKGKAIIIFIENQPNARPGAGGICAHCEVSAALGMDGSWIAATRGSPTIPFRSIPVIITSVRLQILSLVGHDF